MASKRSSQQHSSFNEYLDALHKLNPQLKTLLSHISTITATQQSAAAETSETSSGARKTRCASTKKPTCATRRKNSMAASEQEIQAVTNTGRIVYGVVNGEGKLEVKGQVGEVKEDLLGLDLDVVNAGKKNNRAKSKNTSRKKTVTIQDSDDGMH